MLSKIGNWIMGVAFKFLKKKAIKAIVRTINDKVMPALKLKAAKLGADFSIELRKLAAKGKLSAENAEQVETLLEELNEAFWKGANLDD